MSNDRFRKGMGHIDDHLLERYHAYEERLSQSKRAKILWLRRIAVAACLTLIIIGICAAIPPYVPVYESAMFTAEEIAALFSGQKTDGVATNAYTKVRVPSGEDLDLMPLPTEEYLYIYQSTDTSKLLSRLELSAFADRILPKLMDALGEELPTYTTVASDERLTVNVDNKNYSISINQLSSRNSVHVRSNIFPGLEIPLDGEVIQVDQTKTDAQIIADLKSVKEKLFDIFGVSFSDAKVNRYYDDDSEHGAIRLAVLFYNDTPKYPLNDYYIFSDSILLSFDNFQNWSDDVVSDTVLSNVFISYIQYRQDAADRLTTTAKVRRISLKEAEAMLLNGYVFSGHVCPLCMAAQDKVDFSGYDYVELTYVSGRVQEDSPSIHVPFYAFYKRIGTGKNGNEIYAKTYVPAVEVSGLSEYFISQIAFHESE